MGKWTPTREAPEPLEGNVVAVVTGGTVLWFVMFLVQIPFYRWFEGQGLLWWLWTCLAGGGLGLYGIHYVRGREAALRRTAEEPSGAPGPAGPAPTDPPAEPGTAEPGAGRDPRTGTEPGSSPDSR
ncbi:DUF2530 domain-containing protein [Streptomyces sp. S07_1.15]|uniref:DUF2530 domain-containing protein n=1 Tax=Streptomyces sp. S07_1.15 TaxID=2873925 RepID=UPI001D13CDCF|nr:DUF2530 domain-containing protein [Streptomyces sp. S07_1.15]MCC3653279.1 DUF2530 domain-containing protein [Streptomyces sp. S07_1.15]